MKGNTLSVKNLAQIRQGEVAFGDFTLVVGPQASGKSIFLQLLKLLIDGKHISQTLDDHGFVLKNTFELFFGETLSRAWQKETEVVFNGNKISRMILDLSLNTIMLSKRRHADHEEKLFYIPAQRVMAMPEGWPKIFTTFSYDDSYVVRRFSELIRQLMDEKFPNGQSPSEKVFPKKSHMREPLRRLIDDSIFYGSSIELDRENVKKQFRLNVEGNHLPFMQWSTGQKEFMPLMLSLYYLIPSSKVSMRAGIKWVVVEEPEMGLHPQAIQAIMIILLELVTRGYKVVVSTHSPVLVELAWVMQYVKGFKGRAEDLCVLFNLPKNSPLKDIFKIIIEQKIFKTYYFDRQTEGVFIKDISTLDAGSEDPAISNWGGLSEFASRASEVVSKLVANGN